MFFQSKIENIENFDVYDTEHDDDNSDSFIGINDFNADQSSRRLQKYVAAKSENTEKSTFENFQNLQQLASYQEDVVIHVEFKKALDAIKWNKLYSKDFLKREKWNVKEIYRFPAEETIRIKDAISIKIEAVFLSF